jgi:uncharacterized protein YfaS (alpha-2-macroglobulin family)
VPVKVRRYFQQALITDLSPAGFEIENPRTKDIPGMDKGQSCFIGSI